MIKHLIKKSSQMSSQQKTEKSQKHPIYANVYHFWKGFNMCCSCFGLGVYHTGIQYSDYQYMYYGFDGDQPGVIAINPQSASYQFQQKILLGYTDYTYHQFYKQIIEPLQHEFTGNRYDLLSNNCNHFAHRMSQMLKLQKQFPPKVFTLTGCCNNFRCCIPQCILNGRLDWFDFGQKQQGQYQPLQETNSKNINK